MTTAIVMPHTFIINYFSNFSTVKIVNSCKYTCLNKNSFDIKLYQQVRKVGCKSLAGPQPLQSECLFVFNLETGIGNKLEMIITPF